MESISASPRRGIPLRQAAVARRLIIGIRLKGGVVVLVVVGAVEALPIVPGLETVAGVDIEHFLAGVGIEHLLIFRDVDILGVDILLDAVLAVADVTDVAAVVVVVVDKCDREGAARLETILGKSFATVRTVSRDFTVAAATAAVAAAAVVVAFADFLL
eukprot:CAMPEP_0202453210 /NCGR_PEP_ID=MMETSP1360-20130828/11230_1 /ASSEMBLY_ACC=CAM_ASM_000848 /TAXON_ID=515479 /ORGANISM="Licmophora paradoxa, Strain CCMP2313" /LENGTH=158 /DNA_ID=CAMNT_0049072241 /DNA_START=138 /DNA_END=611 /DNA_ORIENTATION=-